MPKFQSDIMDHQLCERVEKSVFIICCHYYCKVIAYRESVYKRSHTHISLTFSLSLDFFLFPPCMWCWIFVRVLCVRVCPQCGYSRNVKAKFSESYDPVPLSSCCEYRFRLREKGSGVRSTAQSYGVP